MISITIVLSKKESLRSEHLFDRNRSWCKIFGMGNKNSSLTIADNIITRLKQEREYVLIS